MILRSIKIAGSILLLFFWACGDGSGSETLEEPNFNDSIPQMDSSNRFDASAFAKIQEERSARGDTIPEVHTRLGQILPDSLPGFRADIDDGGTFQTRDFAFSEATRVYYDQDENYIEINVADYIADPDFFASVL